LQLKHGRRNPDVRSPNTLDALKALHSQGYLSDENHEFFHIAYRLLRTIESRLQLMNAAARSALPDDSTELSKLAHLLRYNSADALLADCGNSTSQIRQRFDVIFDEAGPQKRKPQGKKG